MSIKVLSPKILVLLPFWLVVITVRAQFAVNIVPPSVESANHFKGMHVNESLFTGAANISIPIHTIQSKGITVPISIHYDTHGIKVGDISSRLGSGWSMSYGGKISRQTVGLPDESSEGILNQHTYFGDNSLFSASPQKRQQYYAYSLNHEMDKFSDYFFLELNGRSYKFIIDPTTKLPLLQKYDDLIIEVIGLNDSGSPRGIKGWIITDSNGTKYFFGKSKDQQRSAYDYDRVNTVYTMLYPEISFQQNNISDDAFINTWQLMEIEDIYGDKVDYHYLQEQALLYRKNYDLDGTLVFGEQYTNATIKSQFSLLTQYQSQLSRINFKNGYILCNRANVDRSDLIGSRALTSIVLYGTDGFIGQTNLYHSNVSADAPLSTVNRYLRTMDPSASQRLFLDSIASIAANSERQAYRFTYDSVKLPNRHSTSQDNWGYYNGRANGEFLVFFDTFGKVDRSVDGSFSKAGLLTKVQYPNGGTDQFIYEPNRGRMSVPSGNILVRDIVEQVTEQNLQNLMRAAKHWKGSYFGLDFVVSGISSPIQWSMEFPYPNSTEHYNIYLRDKNTNVERYLAYDIAQNLRTISIPNGDYELKIIPLYSTPPDFSNFEELFVFRLNWTSTTSNYPDPDDTQVIFGPGLRIKQVQKFDGAIIAKDTEYKYSGEDNMESGVIHGVPGFVERNRGFAVSTIMLGQASLPGTPFSTFSNGEIGYGVVREIEVNSNLNYGYSKYMYTNFVDGDEFYSFPYHPPRDNSWLRGHLLSKQIFQSKGGAFEKVQEIQNIYRYGGIESASKLTIDPQRTHMDSIRPPSMYAIGRLAAYRPYLLMPVGNEGDIATGTGFKVYHFTGGTFDLAKNRNVSYFYNAASSLIGEVVQEVSYGYNYPQNYKLHRSAESVSQNSEDSVITIHTYPLFNDPLQGGNLLVQRNVIVPLSTSVYKHGILTSMEKNYYAANPTGLITLTKRELTRTDQQDKKSYYVLSTDDFGNTVEVKDDTGPSTVYLWGYSGQYPIAKIQNASYQDIQDILTVTEINSLNAASVSESTIRTVVAKLRNHADMRKAQVSTYTYKPLVGMTSMTDARGVTEYYKYDGFQRLKDVLDFESNVLKDYRYNYKP